MKKVIILLTLIVFILLGCEKENNTNKIINFNHPLICNPDKINGDSVVYVQFEPAVTFPSRNEFNSSDSLFLDTTFLDFNSDGIIDFKFFTKEVYSRGPFFYCNDSMFKYLHVQEIHLKTDSVINISSHWSEIDLLFDGSIIDSLNSIRYDFFWHPARFDEDLFWSSGGVIDPEVIEYYLPFMYRDNNKPRYGWIRFRFSMIQNLNTIYYSGNYYYYDYIVKTEILDYAYQKF